MPFVKSNYDSGKAELATAILFLWIHEAFYGFVPSVRAEDSLIIEKFTRDDETSAEKGRFWFRIRNLTKDVIVKEHGPFKKKDTRDTELELIGTQNNRKMKSVNLDKPAPRVVKEKCGGSRKVASTKASYLETYATSFPEEFRKGALVLPNEKGEFVYGDMRLETNSRVIHTPSGTHTVPKYYHHVLMAMCARPKVIFSVADLCQLLGRESGTTDMKSVSHKMIRIRNFMLRLGLRATVRNKQKHGYYLTTSIRDGV